MEKVIQITNLTKKYPLKQQESDQKSFLAVSGISFFVKKGEVFGILGPNGAGKTTTLEIIESLIKQTSGTVEVLGMDNLRQSDAIKKRVGVQLQSSKYVPFLTLSELLTLFGSLYGMTKPVNTTRLLQMVGLEDKINEQVQNLSGGQQQRFTIATALVHNPEILFLDEPTTGLDPHARHSLWDLIKKINAQGTTIVMTTHYMEEAEFLCNRVAIMDHGQILKIDEPKKLIETLSDTVQISFLTKEACDAKIFESIAGVKKAYSNIPKTIIEVTHLDVVSVIIKTLQSTNLSYSGFTVKTASLEDVYLKLTGKEYNNI